VFAGSDIQDAELQYRRLSPYSRSLNASAISMCLAPCEQYRAADQLSRGSLRQEITHCAIETGP